jgi:transcriptional regulator with XRE-family HTH domain
LSDEQIGPRRRELARRLKSLRRDSGLSAERLAVQLGWSQSKVSKIENGRTRPTVNDVAVWLQALTVATKDRNELLELALTAETEATTWRSLYSRGFDQRQRHYAQLESEASQLLIYQPAIVPGLFQTADYARRVLTLLGVLDASEIGSAVTSRLERQTILYDEDKSIDAVITEAALRWRPGSTSLSLAQLDRLESLATLPNVHMGIVPLEVSDGQVPLNQFVLFKLGEGLDTVTVETYTAEVSISDPAGVASYETIFNRHKATALHGDAANDLMDRIRKDWAPSKKR